MGLTTGDRTDHCYQTCDDEYCQRFPCRVYREGYRNGFEDGFTKGYAEGHAAGAAAGYESGYSEGFGEGLASCPGPHGG